MFLELVIRSKVKHQGMAVDPILNDVLSVLVWKLRAIGKSRSAALVRDRGLPVHRFLRPA